MKYFMILQSDLITVVNPVIFCYVLNNLLRPRRRWEDNIKITGFSWLRIGSTGELL